MMKMTPEKALDYVNHGDEVIASMARGYVEMWLAIAKIYCSANWTPDRPLENNEQLWDNLRAACNLTKSQAPKKFENIESPPRMVDNLVQYNKEKK